jgi:hypothetical protein
MQYASSVGLEICNGEDLDSCARLIFDLFSILLYSPAPCMYLSVSCAFIFFVFDSSLFQYMDRIAKTFYNVDVPGSLLDDMLGILK